LTLPVTVEVGISEYGGEVGGWIISRSWLDPWSSTSGFRGEKVSQIGSEANSIDEPSEEIVASIHSDSLVESKTFTTESIEIEYG